MGSQRRVSLQGGGYRYPRPDPGTIREIMLTLSERLTHREIENVFHDEHPEYQTARIHVPHTKPGALPIAVDFCDEDGVARPYNVFIEGKQRRTHDLDDAVLQIELALGIQRTEEDFAKGQVALEALGAALIAGHQSRDLPPLITIDHTVSGRAIGVTIRPSVRAYIDADQGAARIVYDPLWAPEGPYRLCGVPWSRGRTLDDIVHVMNNRFAGM